MADVNFETLRGEYKIVLRQAFKTKNVELFKAKIKSYNKSEIALKNPLDQAFRDNLLEFLEKETSVNILKNYVSFCIETCRHGLTTSTLPVQILGDIFEALTLDACQDMFSFVEENVSVWKEELFFSGCKNNLLRLCNDLLRRLSRSTATIFCGRILLFLAKFFPFSERSGLNIVSEFNLENVTQYGTDSTQESIIEIESGDKKNIVIDFTLYCKFWSLQDFFRYPTQCYDKVQWKLFCSHSQSILSIFQGLKLEYIGKNVGSTERKDTMYFSKYLTSQKLLDLQLYDNNFRRFVLLQFLILFQYLTSSVKFKSESFELKTDQKEWIHSTTEKIYKLLKETPPDGERFADIVSNILSREEYWNAWKNDGCPEFKKQSTLSEPLEKSQNKSNRPFLGDLIKQANKENKYYMGSNELTKLWNLCPDNLEACKGKERDFLPTLENYFKDAIEQMESGEIIKDEQNLLKDSNFGWRALRLLARRSRHFFTFSTVIMNQQSSYIEMMVKKIMQEQKSKKDGAASNQESHQDNEEMETENLFKEESENTEDMKDDANTEEFVDDKNPRNDSKNINDNQLQFISEKVVMDWKKLAAKLGFKPDEIEFFEQEKPTDLERSKSMLQLWFEDDEDATIENFTYILEGLEMYQAAEAIKAEFNISFS